MPPQSNRSGRHGEYVPSACWRAISLGPRAMAGNAPRHCWCAARASDPGADLHRRLDSRAEGRCRPCCSHGSAALRRSLWSLLRDGDLDDHLKPEIERRVLSLWPTKLPTQLGLVAFPKHFWVKSGTQRQAFDVFAIAIDISSQLRQDEIVSFECFEAQVSKGAGHQIQQ